ncbi:MAG: spinster family MFS transporter [Gammaproteobacteria bacterium]
MTPAPTTPGTASPAYPRPLVAWYTTGLLCFLFWLSILDRYIIAFLVDPIRADLGIGDVEIGLLQGVAFATFYAVFGLPIGWAIDRFSRRWIVLGAVMFWSIATAACGLARSFWQLFAARVAVGAGESALNPAAYSILADMFPRERMALPMAVFALGAVFGSGFAYAFGGLIIEVIGRHGTLVLPVFGEIRPWQGVFIAVGLPGLLFALLMLTIPEPLRRGLRPAADRPRNLPFAELFAFMRRHARFYVCHHAGYTLLVVVSSGVTLWGPSYLIRTFDWAPGKAGVALGLTIVAGGVLGSWLVGRAIDRWTARGVDDAPMRMYALCAGLAFPIGMIMLLANDPWIFLGGKFLYQILMTTYPAAGSASLVSVAPNQLRGQSVSVCIFFASLVGTGLGSVLVGVFTEFLFQDPAKVGWSIALLMALALPAAAVLHWAGCAPMRAAVAEVRGAAAQ